MENLLNDLMEREVNKTLEDDSASYDSNCGQKNQNKKQDIRDFLCSNAEQQECEKSVCSQAEKSPNQEQ